jgi:uncharacterized membrane protein
MAAHRRATGEHSGQLIGGIFAGMDHSSTATQVAVDPRHVSYANIVYGLHALTIVVGLFSARYIAREFVFSVPALVAVVMNYARRDQVRGTWLESHFRWQIRSFWTALIALLVIRLVFGPLSWVWIGLPFLLLGYGLIGLWAVYRVARGWLALREGRTMPVGGF